MTTPTKLRARAEAAADAVCSECPGISGGYPVKRAQIADAIERVAREFAAQAVRAHIKAFAMNEYGATVAADDKYTEAEINAAIAAADGTE